MTRIDSPVDGVDGVLSASDVVPASARRSTRGTVLPRQQLKAEAEPETRVRTRGSRDDQVSVWSAGAAGLGMALFLSAVLGIVTLPWLPFVAYALFVGIYTSLTFLTNNGPAVRDRFWGVLLRSAGFVVVACLALVVVFTVTRGWPVVTDVFSGKPHNPLHFLTDDMAGVSPLNGLDVGGIVYALVGTMEQIGIALAITIPLGLTAAIFLSEVGGKYARFVRTIVEAMTALPSVVAGLFIYAVIIVEFTHEDNGFAAALAITVLMLPIMIRASDVALRLTPGGLREASLALGASRWSTVWHVVLPTMRSGLTTAIILATAHGIGETAPVLLTSGVTSVTNFNPFANNQTSLPLAALEFIESGTTTAIQRGYATAAFLLVLVLVLFFIARVVGGQEAGKISHRQHRRLGRKSQRSLRRMQRPAAVLVDDPLGFPLDSPLDSLSDEYAEYPTELLPSEPNNDTTPLPAVPPNDVAPPVPPNVPPNAVPPNAVPPNAEEA